MAPFGMPPDINRSRKSNMAFVKPEIIICWRLEKKTTPFHLHRAVIGIVPLHSSTTKMVGLAVGMALLTCLEAEI